MSSFNFGTVFVISGVLSCLVSASLDDLSYYETFKSEDIRTRTKRSADPNPYFHMREFQFSVLGKDFHLYLKQSDILSQNFTATAVGAGGKTTKFNLDTSQFLKGHLKDDKKSLVHVHLDDNVITASIITDKDVYFIEPSRRYFGDSHDHDMIAYRKSDLKFEPSSFNADARGSKFCGVQDKRKPIYHDKEGYSKLYPNADSRHGREKRQASYSFIGTHTKCRLTVVADHYFYTNIGRGDRFQTSAYIISLMDRVNGIYTKTLLPDYSSGIKDVSFEIAEMIILEESTPVDGKHFNMDNRPADMSDVLDLFGEAYVSEFSKVCLGHLFTYQKFPGKLGLAYVASARMYDLGGICSKYGWINSKQQAVNTGVSTFQNPGGSTAITLQATITVAHGHNMGSEHDPITDDCAPSSSQGGKYIMYPYSVSGFQTNNNLFSPCSRQYIYKVIKVKGYDCFVEPSPGGLRLCGNGRLDPDEECDAGYYGDNCCKSDCTLIKGTCSHMNFPCCDKTECRVAPRTQVCFKAVENFDCKRTQFCNGNDLTCPPLENVNNGKQCGNVTMNVCYDGECLDPCQQKGKTPCVCESEQNSCLTCCKGKDEGDSMCKPLGDLNLPDGSPCYQGFCNQGTCEKSLNYITRLFNILEYFSKSRIAEIMKDNLVWIILLLMVIVWAIAIPIVEHVDRKGQNKKMEESRKNMSRRRHDTTLPGEAPLERVSRRIPERHLAF